MGHTARAVKEFFGRVATDWDTMRLAYYDERMIEKMAGVSRLREGMTVADVDTGTGFMAAGLAPRVERVVGVDNSRAMLEVARENLRSLGVENVDLAPADVARLPMADASVDTAFANMVLHHAEDPPAMLR
jgi:ubiquinone/menaquinone biosynthesis C-methylase UbiE